MLDPARDFETARFKGLSTSEMLSNCDTAIEGFANRIAELAKTPGVMPEQYVLARAWNEAEQTNFQSSRSCETCKTTKGN
jgi:hypothetical protein